MVATCTVLSIGWNESCEQPLNYWLLVYTLRHFINIPLRIYMLSLASYPLPQRYPFPHPSTDSVEEDVIQTPPCQSKLSRLSFPYLRGKKHDLLLPPSLVGTAMDKYTNIFMVFSWTIFLIYGQIMSRHRSYPMVLFISYYSLSLYLFSWVFLFLLRSCAQLKNHVFYA